ncbi:glycosyltransferase [Tenacibaculum discolor]|uniref:glycosyltransferase n=1 Tax=Tenacibaculum discolor TaxID=361581 RepID=UPI000EB1F3BC|nr:glycosyltransferase [Tenacibaculum discolor]RLJ97683.1 glycosyltransferase involved in cell wall biosynthesis [Tenacibaculum discolor]
MRILHVISSLNTGGAEKLIVDSIPEYQKKKLSVDVLVLKDDKTEFRSQLEARTNGTVTGLTRGSVYNPFLIIKIIPFLKQYSLIHVHLFPALYWVVFAKILSFSKKPIVYTEHSTENRRRGNKLFKKIDKYIYSKLDFIGCISQATYQNLQGYLKRDDNRLKVIENGINLNDFQKKRYQKKYSFFDKENFVLIQVSSFREQKDQQTLIKALTKLPESIKLLLVGDGELRKEREKQVFKLGLKDRVFFTGKRYDIPELYSYSDVAILSSNYEGFGLAIVEGMASKKPVIASSVDGLREIVEGYGLLFEKGNSDSLAEKILKLYENKTFYKEVAEKCYHRSNNFSIETMVKKYINVYKNETY